MIVDEYEPLEITNGLTQVFPDTLKLPLNRNGWADYKWEDWRRLPSQAERKQVGEILSGMEHVEEQLRGEIQAHPEAKLTLIVEGVAEPKPGGVQTYTISKNGQVFRQGRSYNIRFERYEGFLTALDREGIRVWRTSSWQGTVEALVRFQKQALEPNTSLFERHLRVPTFQPNPYVQLLMNLRYYDEQGKSRSAGVGEKTALELIRVWRTPWELFRQEADTVVEYTNGVGEVTVDKIFKSIGR